MLFLMSIGLALMSISKLYSSAQSYFQKNIKQSYRNFLFAIVLIIPFFSIVLFALNRFDFIELTQKIAIIVLFISSFFALFVGFFFFFALRTREIKKMIFLSVVGGAISLLFIPSLYFTISPIIKWKLQQNEIRERHLKFVSALRREPQKVFDFIALETGKILPQKSRIVEIKDFKKSSYMNITIETTESFVTSFPQFIIVYPQDNKNSYVHYYIMLEKANDRNDTLYLSCSY